MFGGEVGVLGVAVSRHSKINFMAMFCTSIHRILDVQKYVNFFNKMPPPPHYRACS